MTIMDFGRKSFVTWPKGLKERIAEKEKQMSQRIREEIEDDDGARGERFRLIHQLGEFIDPHTTIFGITPSHPKAEEKLHEIIHRFLYGDQKDG